MSVKSAVLFIILMQVVIVSAVSAALSDNKILIVKSSELAMYQNAALAFKKYLATSDNDDLMTIDSLILAELDNDALPFSASYDLILTIGTEAADQILSINMQIPIISILVAREAYQHLIKRVTRKPNAEFNAPRTAIYLDQPFQRQVALAYLVDSRGGIGMLGEPFGNSRLNSGSQCFSSEENEKFRGVSIHDENISMKVLSQVLDESGIAIATPKFVKQMAGNAKWLLYMAYQRNVPLIGYSESFVKAGAIAALFSTPANYGKEAAEIVERIFHMQHYAVAPAKYPRYFNVRVNQRVARSLGFRHLREPKLENSLGEMEIACSDFIRQNNSIPKQRLTELQQNNMR